MIESIIVDNRNVYGLFVSLNFPHIVHNSKLHNEPKELALISDGKWIDHRFL